MLCNVFRVVESRVALRVVFVCWIICSLRRTHTIEKSNSSILQQLSSCKGGCLIIHASKLRWRFQECVFTYARVGFSATYTYD